MKKEDKRNPAAVALGKRRLAAPKAGQKNPEAVALGQRGGFAAAASMTVQQRSKRGRKAAAGRWKNRLVKEGG